MKPSERFFVSRESVLNEMGAALFGAVTRALSPVAQALIGDDVVVSAGGMVPDGQGAEFLLGLSVEAGRERLSRMSGKGGDAWNGAVALKVQRELKRAHDVFVLHRVVSRVAGVEVVTVWSAEVHVMPNRLAVFKVAAEKSLVKLTARVQAMTETAWSRLCEREGVACGLAVRVSVGNTVVDSSPLSEVEALMMMMPDGWDEENGAAF